LDLDRHDVRADLKKLKVGRSRFTPEAETN
jgi:hypothetical protein